jgi:hypothetical protein
MQFGDILNPARPGSDTRKSLIVMESVTMS